MSHGYFILPVPDPSLSPGWSGSRSNPASNEEYSNSIAHLREATQGTIESYNGSVPTPSLPPINPSLPPIKELPSLHELLRDRYPFTAVSTGDSGYRTPPYPTTVFPSGTTQGTLPQNQMMDPVAHQDLSSSSPPTNHWHCPQLPHPLDAPSVNTANLGSQMPSQPRWSLTSAIVHKSVKYPPKLEFTIFDSKMQIWQSLTWQSKCRQAPESLKAFLAPRPGSTQSLGKRLVKFQLEENEEGVLKGVILGWEKCHEQLEEYSLAQIAYLTKNPNQIDGRSREARRAKKTAGGSTQA
ncbi:hypothetical protein QFC21_006690 [Naganishia friedmannii]|uniref:Uncharacterized protein n=1 Tax=Naganishia friedmannii TaxID=89922 RepID=A0ACC2V0F1_9TREE|nr:hypothetical protein QFC21_006690 [Naganishia friedmannii]